MNISFVLYGAILFASFSSAWASTNVNTLQWEMNGLKKQIKVLSKELNNVEKKLNKKHKVTTGGGNLSVRNKSKNKTFKINGLVQTDIEAYDGAYNYKNNGERGSDFFARRIQMSVGGKNKDWDYKLLLGFSKDYDYDSEVVLSRVRYSGFKNGPIIKFGKIREDTSLEALTSSASLTSISRSMLADTIAPYYSWGVGAYQNIHNSGLRYAFGVYKGGHFGASGKDENNDLTFSYSGRLTWGVPLGGNNILHIGAWGSQREFGENEELSMVKKGEVRTAERLLDYAAGGSKYTVDTLNQYGYELAMTLGSLSLQSEYAIREVEAVDPANNNTYEGFYAQLGFFLTGEHRRYTQNAVFSAPKVGKSGAWEILLKTSMFDAINDSGTQGTKVEVDTIGINYYLTSKIVFMLNHLRSEVSGPGAPSLVGVNTDGKAWIFRMQYAF